MIIIFDLILLCSMYSQSKSHVLIATSFIVEKESFRASFFICLFDPRRHSCYHLSEGKLDEKKISYMCVHVQAKDLTFKGLHTTRPIYFFNIFTPPPLPFYFLPIAICPTSIIYNEETFSHSISISLLRSKSKFA